MKGTYIMTNAEKALQLHEEWNGKFETTPKMSINLARLLLKIRKLLTSTLSKQTLLLLYLTEVLSLDLAI